MCFYDILRVAVWRPGFLCIITVEGKDWREGIETARERGSVCISLAVGIPSCFLLFNSTCRPSCGKHYMLEYCAVSIFADLVVKSESLVKWSSRNLSYSQNSLDFFADLNLRLLSRTKWGHLISRSIHYPHCVTKKNPTHLQKLSNS